MISLQIEIFILMIIGYLLSKKGYFNKETRIQITNIVLMIILPCSIIKSFQIDISYHLLVSFVVILTVSFGIQCSYSILNKFLYNHFEESEKICCQYGTMVSNAGFMGMPIAEGVFGELGLLYASIFLIPQRVFMWTAGLKMFTKKEQQNILIQVLTHPCIIAIYIGIVLMVFRNIGIFMPKVMQDTLTVISQCNTAISMFIIGGILSDVDKEELFNKKSLLYSLYRLIVIPLIIYISVLFLPIDRMSANLCVLLSAMPAASTTAMLAQKYQGNAKFASQLIFSSTLLSLFTLPLIVKLF